MDWLKSDRAKLIGALLAAIAGVLLTQFPPPQLVGVISTIALGILTALGLISGGTSSARSDASRAQTQALTDKGVLPK